MSQEDTLLSRVQVACDDTSLYPLHLWKSHNGELGVFQSKEHGYVGFGMRTGENFQYLQQGYDLDANTLMSQAQAIAAFAGALELRPASEEVRQVTVYKQGAWIETTLPSIPDDVIDWFTYQGYPSKPAVVVGVEEQAELAVWIGPFIDTEKTEIRTPLYRYCVELVINHHTNLFYIADEGSYLQILPHLIDIVQKTLQVKLTIQQNQTH